VLDIIGATIFNPLGTFGVVFNGHEFEPLGQPVHAGLNGLVSAPNVLGP